MFSFTPTPKEDVKTIDHMMQRMHDEVMRLHTLCDMDSGPTKQAIEVMEGQGFTYLPERRVFECDGVILQVRQRSLFPWQPTRKQIEAMLRLRGWIESGRGKWRWDQLLDRPNDYVPEEEL
jgi:hypothetical protein